MASEPLVNQPALAERCDGSGPVPGQVAHVREEPGGSKRVQLRTDGGSLNTARERVSVLTDDVQALVRIVERECGEPTDEGEHATMAGYAAVVGQAHSRTDIGRNELDHVLRAAVFSDALVEWTTGDGRWFVPHEEDALRTVIAEENRRAEPSRELIEHCADAIQEVADDE